MCGISLILQYESDQQAPDAPSPVSSSYSSLPAELAACDVDQLHKLLQARGPDGINSLKVPAFNSRCRLHLLASLLQLRGVVPGHVPLQHPASGDVLCFNGEVFGGVHVPPSCNDGEVLLQALSTCHDVAAVLSSLQGPWSLIYWQPSSGRLWFGRDAMGRRSLLAHVPTMQDDVLVLTSVAPVSGSQAGAPLQVRASGSQGNDEEAEEEAQGSGDDQAYWKEVPPGLYCICAGDAVSEPAHIQQEGQQQQQQKGEEVLDSSISPAACSPRCGSLPAPGSCLQLPGGLQLHCLPWQHPTPSAIAAYQRLEGSQPAPPAVSPGAADRTQLHQASSTGCVGGGAGGGEPAPALGAVEQLMRGAGALCLHDSLQDVCAEAAMHMLLQELQRAVEVRCKCIERATLDSAKPSTPSADPTSITPILPDLPQPNTSGSTIASSPVMILFSGGVDSVLLAALVHRSLPPSVPVDLCNVCFDGGRSPDRLAARSALEELCSCAPDREWRLIEVDSSLEQVDVHKQRLLTLLHPAATIMDLNIGAALWLAAAGSGRLHLPQAQQQQQPPIDRPSTSCNVTTANHVDATRRRSYEGMAYRSEARVVFLGHGADEQCAGYGRHRTRFRTGGVAALARELSLDVRRMWLRNCGRDDRLVADHGREARHPFLDEGVMELLLRLPLHVIADLRQPPGQGDKRILRQALQHLGLPQTADRVKRAIQFGSRIGKLSNRREFGSNRAANKLNAGSLSLDKIPLRPA